MPRKTLLILSLGLNIAVVLFFIGKRIYWSYYKNPVTYSYTVADYMIATANLQSNLAIDTGDIVFVGNSLTSHFPMEMFGDTKYKNRGVGSNTTKEILDRIKPIAEAHPAVIITEVGFNDISAGRPVIQAFNNYCNIIQIIRTTAPRTTLIVQSTLPVGDIKYMPSVDSLNTLLKQHCIENKIQYLDLHPVLRKGAGLDSTLTWDGIHLNYEGYKRWYDTVNKFL